MGFSRQEYWSGLPCPSPGDLPDLGIELGSYALQADSLLSYEGNQIHVLMCNVLIVLYIKSENENQNVNCSVVSN